MSQACKLTLAFANCRLPTPVRILQAQQRAVIQRRSKQPQQQAILKRKQTMAQSGGESSCRAGALSCLHSDTNHS